MAPKTPSLIIKAPILEAQALLASVSLVLDSPIADKKNYGTLGFWAMMARNGQILNSNS